ncbi:unnamed protein product [Diatraea saccharalis]|uniref:Ionotropic receptor 75a N-terminal domain-containing protein n=1 Tax=Diatraea saccharalis TaxID=40085 RepID=A0A9N9QWG1_9NEOP|nr:unnamed protein product [Diatraea saccharalis]
MVLQKFIEKNVRVSAMKIGEYPGLSERFVHQWNVPVGLMMDASCNASKNILEEASRQTFFGSNHAWLILIDANSTIEEYFENLELSIDANIVVVQNNGDSYQLIDVFNYGKVQGNSLEVKLIGVWNDTGLDIPKDFKYYTRWNFNNLTLRAISVAVTNSLFWREQDISCTCARIYPKWMEWVDIFFPPATKIETKFYYLIPDKGVGDYENRFLTPLSPGVWWCACLVLVACGALLAAAARLEGRPQPGLYALCSVLAAVCQQAYEDGVQMLEEYSSQGRRTTVLVVGVTSMLLYNYYTSSVVSWLLNAAVPSIDSIPGLIASDLELIFENIGYAKQWLDNPGFYYFAGYKNAEEDDLRDKKVTKTRRTTAILQPAEAGIELIRHGGMV